MEVVELSLPGLKLIKPRVFRDERGFFLETFRSERYRAAGISCDFVQDNHSRSVRGTLRGLHYQSSPGQAKLLRVVSGRIFDVAVDIRPESPTFGKWEGVYLDAEEHHQMFVPLGFAHGFCVVSESADVLYKVSSPYDGATECTLQWNDPIVGVRWPVDEPVLSPRDQSGEPFSELARR
ncbi:MAG TPA: dTDP-4-dehydrorhamnose 3,5-epimerase, partial [Polyangiaceae bacterium]